MKTLFVLFLAALGWAIHMDNAHADDRYVLGHSTIIADNKNLVKFEKGLEPVECTKDTADIKDVDDDKVPYVATFYYCDHGEYYMVKRNFPGTKKEFRTVSWIVKGEIRTSGSYYPNTISK